MNEWTPEEDAILREHRPHKTFPALAKMLRRSEDAIRQRSRRLMLAGPAINKADALCWRCRKACGGCAWSNRLMPVDGWTAQETTTGYLVIGCPLFAEDEKREVN